MQTTRSVRVRALGRTGSLATMSLSTASRFIADSWLARSSRSGLLHVPDEVDEVPRLGRGDLGAVGRHRDAAVADVAVEVAVLAIARHLGEQVGGRHEVLCH